MGLNAQFTGKKAAEKALFIKNGNHKTIALAGNPNVGKSTVFNSLTGMKQHTGNWTGKTVDSAIGKCHYKNYEIEIIDLPGTYSLKSYSEEEMVATDFILKKEYDVAVVGAGYAGCEAALAAARLGMKTLVFSISLSVLK